MALRADCGSWHGGFAGTSHRRSPGSNHPAGLGGQARTAPWWLAAALIIGAVLVIVSGEGGIVTVALIAPLAVAVAGLGVVLWRADPGASNARRPHPAILAER
jgi:hypothetical protein